LSLSPDDLGNYGSALPGQPSFTHDLKHIGLNIQYGIVPPVAKTGTLFVTGDTYNLIPFNDSFAQVDTTNWAVNITGLPNPICATVCQVNAQGYRTGPAITNVPVPVNDPLRRLIWKFTRGFHDSIANPLCRTRFIPLKPQPGVTSAPLLSSPAFVQFIVTHQPQIPVGLDATLTFHTDTPLLITLDGVNMNQAAGGQPLADPRKDLQFLVTSVPLSGTLYQVINDVGNCASTMMGAAILSASTRHTSGAVDQFTSIPVTSSCGQVMFVPVVGASSPAYDDPYAEFHFHLTDGTLYSDLEVSPTLLGNRIGLVFSPTPQVPLSPSFDVHSSVAGGDIRVFFVPESSQLYAVQLRAINVQIMPASGRLLQVDSLTGRRGSEIFFPQVPYRVLLSSAFPMIFAENTRGAGFTHIGLIYMPNDETIIGVAVDSFTYLLETTHLLAPTAGTVTVTVQPVQLTIAPTALPAFHPAVQDHH
jgi:hypothetical protein